MNKKSKEKMEQMELRTEYDDFFDEDYMYTKIEQLKSEKKYDEIYFQFGSVVYNETVPRKYKKEDLKQLKKEGRYEEIFNKYGEVEYSKILITSMYNEIKESKGIVKAIAWRTKENFLRRLKSFGLATALALPTLTGTVAISTNQEIKENAVTYEDEIQSYNTKINAYAKEIQSMNLDDIQIFMKVMNDMWENIKGYGEPEKDISGFLELDLATEEGVGVCRNMASDTAKKLNAIDSKYNARTMNVYVSEYGDYQIADIERNIIETNDTVVNDDSETGVEENEIVDKIVEKVVSFTGNHMVTFADIPEENLTLVLDPTNPGIGIYQNGKIIMLNGNSKYSAKEFSDIVIIKGGIDGNSVANSYINSFKATNINFEEIQQKYGLEAQNEALVQIRKMSTDYESGKGENSFDERYKVDSSEIDWTSKSIVDSSDEKSEDIEK